MRVVQRTRPAVSTLLLREPPRQPRAAARRASAEDMRRA